MIPSEIRRAALDDTAAISSLFRARIAAWQRLDADGRVDDVAYDALTLYERWLHGGAWMSLETGAIHLGRLLAGAGVPLVAVANGAVVGYAEAYPGVEPPPFGAHLHLAHLIGAGENALLAALAREAAALKLTQVTVNRVPADGESVWTETARLAPLARVRRYTLPARTGQIFYQATEHPNADAAQITGWHLTVGRVGSAREQWEALWHTTWDIVPELRRQQTARLRFTAAGQEAFASLHQQMYNPRAVEVTCWSPKALSGQLLTALRDWAHRAGYRTLVMVVSDDVAKTLGSEAEPDGFAQDVCTLRLS